MPDTVRQIAVPSISSLSRLQIETGYNHEAVLMVLTQPTAMILFTPMEARSIAARFLELADHVDGGRGVS